MSGTVAGTTSCSGDSTGAGLGDETGAGAAIFTEGRVSYAAFARSSSLM